MRHRKLGRTAGLLAGVVVVASSLAACGGGADATDSTVAAATSASAAVAVTESAEVVVENSAAAEPSLESESVPPGDVPDPCGLLAQDQIAAILGDDPGPGELAGDSPNLRQVCTYPNGTILGVEVGIDYDAALSAIEAAGLGGESTELSGLGERAALVTYDMGVVQVFAVEGDYMVDVTGMITKKQATALAEAMLAAM